MIRSLIHQQRFSLNRIKGFLLIEVLIAILIVSIGIGGLVALNNALHRINANFKQTIQAINIARNEIETLRSYNSLTINSNGYTAYNNLTSLNNTTNWLPAAATGDNTTFTGTLYVTSNISPAYTLVDVVVNWTDNEGATHSVELATIITPIDPIVAGNMLV